MPHDVIMPALGISQDTGKLIAWLKAPGDAVAPGDILFEVETDKTTLEVEAQAAGTLADVAAEAGADIPVGEVIARILPEGSAPAGRQGQEGAQTTAPAERGDGSAPAGGSDVASIPGHTVVMPALGMAQETGKLLAWSKAPGDPVAAGDILFEVETDKAAMEVEADRAGFLAATLAAEGEDVPVGEPVAIIAVERPEKPLAQARGRASTSAAAPPEPAAVPAAQQRPPAGKPTPARPNDVSAPGSGTRQESRKGASPAGRILASPKARRLARERGVDLSDLAAAGHPAPYHVADLDTLAAMPRRAAPGQVAAETVTVEAAADATAFDTFLADLGADRGRTLAAFAARALRQSSPTECIALTLRTGREALTLVDPDLARPAPASDAAPAFVLRDLTATPVTRALTGATEAPVLTVTRAGDRLAITLQAAKGQLDEDAALALVAGLAERIADPCRQLL